MEGDAPTADGALTGPDAFAGMARSYKSSAIPAAGGASTGVVGGAHGPESGKCRGDASTGTGAFAGMARSYRKRLQKRRRVVHPPAL